MKPTVYIETTIPSYVAAEPYADPTLAVHQAVTREWWDRWRPAFSPVTSLVVLRECSKGRPSPATARLALLADVPLLDQSDAAAELTAALMRVLRLPPRLEDDAAHIALSAVNQIDYLLTWNCAHIANPTFARRIVKACAAAGFRPPVIVTPLELTKEANDGADSD